MMHNVPKEVIALITASYTRSGGMAAAREPKTGAESAKLDIVIKF